MWFACGVGAFSLSINQAAIEALKGGIAAHNAVERACIAVEGRAQELCPVRTGRLKNSITHSIAAGGPEGVVGHVGSNVEYAIFVELGTYRMNAEPYLRPALEEVLGANRVKAEVVSWRAAG